MAYSQHFHLKKFIDVECCTYWCQCWVDYYRWMLIFYEILYVIWYHYQAMCQLNSFALYVKILKLFFPKHYTITRQLEHGFKVSCIVSNCSHSFRIMRSYSRNLKWEHKVFMPCITKISQWTLIRKMI